MKEGWEYEKLGNVCVSFSGYTPSADLLKDKGIYPYFKVAEMNRPQNKRTLISTNAYIDNPSRIYKKGAIVFPKNGAAISTNKKRVLAQDSVVDLNTGGFLVDDIKLNNWYFFYYMQHLDFQMFVRRGAVPTLDIAELKKLDVPIPSLSEQQHIVEELDLLSSIIEKKKAQIKELDNLAQSLFYEMFGDPITNEKGWEYFSLENLIKESIILYHLDGNHGGNYPRSEEFVDKGVPYIGANCIRDGEIDFSMAKYLTEEKVMTLRKGIAENNDVLFAHNATVGPVAILRTNEKKVILSTSLTAYRCNTTRIQPLFLKSYMDSSWFVSQYVSIMKQATRNQVPITSQRKMFFILPSIQLQNQFADKVQNIEHQKELIKQSIKEVETLFNSRMDYYFN